MLSLDIILNEEQLIPVLTYSLEQEVFSSSSTSAPHILFFPGSTPCRLFGSLPLRPYFTSSLRQSIRLFCYHPIFRISNPTQEGPLVSILPHLAKENLDSSPPPALAINRPPLSSSKRPRRQKIHDPGEPRQLLPTQVSALLTSNHPYLTSVFWEAATLPLGLTHSYFAVSPRR